MKKFNVYAKRWLDEKHILYEDLELSGNFWSQIEDEIKGLLLQGYEATVKYE